MEFEYWWLAALPIFFGLGWLAARVDIKHLVKDSRALPTSYLIGPDGAVVKKFLGPITIKELEQKIDQAKPGG